MNTLLLLAFWVVPPLATFPVALEGSAAREYPIERLTQYAGVANVSVRIGSTQHRFEISCGAQPLMVVTVSGATVHQSQYQRTDRWNKADGQGQLTHLPQSYAQVLEQQYKAVCP